MYHKLCKCGHIWPICKERPRYERHSTNKRCISSACEESNIPSWSLLRPANWTTNGNTHHHQGSSSWRWFAVTTIHCSRSWTSFSRSSYRVPVHLLIHLRSPRDCGSVVPSSCRRRAVVVPSSCRRRAVVVPSSCRRRAVAPVVDRKLLEWLMSPSPKSKVMFASAFSWIGDFVRIFGIHIFQVMASLLNLV